MPQCNAFWPLQLFFANLGVHWDSHSQSGSSLGNVRVHSLTLFCMKCDSWAPFMACILVSLCFGREPKVKVMTETDFVNIFKIIIYHNPSLGLVTKGRACKVVGQKEAREWKKVWWNEPSHSQKSLHFGSLEFWWILESLAGAKTQWIEEFFVSLESYWNIDV